MPKVKKSEWKRDRLGDYILTIDRSAEHIPRVSARVIRCPIVKQHGKYWRTTSRWLLLVNDHFYGFWGTMKRAQEKFFEDCVPKGNCPECGLPNGSAKCCAEDEDLWK
jgi:hypothetical protein